MNLFRTLTVADWMECERIPHTEEARKYRLGQKLTAEEASEIIRMIARGYGFKAEHPGRTESWTRCNDPYRQVIFKYALLLVYPPKWRSNWADALWHALDEEDRVACNDVYSDYFAYKFNMTNRLEEIQKQQNTSFKAFKRKGYRYV